MDKKAAAEVRKQLTREHCAIDRITGVFVDEDGSVIADLKVTFGALQDEELEKYCEIFKKVLSGKFGRNLFNLSFPLQEEETGGKQWEWYQLLRSGLDNEEAAKEFLGKIQENYNQAGRHLILLAHGAYDIPGRASDGTEMEDASDDVYQFLVAAICPVVEVKEGLCYDAETMTFLNKRSDLGVQLPVQGFLFPAYNDRTPDIHELLYYTKKEDERHEELLDGLVGEAVEVPEGEKAQKELFTQVVEQTLGRSCDFENVKAVNESLNQMIKQDADEGGEEAGDAPLELGKTEIRRVLENSGAPQEAMAHFEEHYDEIIGEGKTLSAENIAAGSTIQLKSPSIKIQVKSEMSSLISTRLIDGQEYICIPVQDDIELNGVRLLTTKLGDGTEDPDSAPFDEGDAPKADLRLNL
jgi:hypothetical protein